MTSKPSQATQCVKLATIHGHVLKFWRGMCHKKLLTMIYWKHFTNVIQKPFIYLRAKSLNITPVLSNLYQCNPLVFCSSKLNVIQNTKCSSCALLPYFLNQGKLTELAISKIQKFLSQSITNHSIFLLIWSFCVILYLFVENLTI